MGFRDGSYSLPAGGTRLELDPQVCLSHFLSMLSFTPCYSTRFSLPSLRVRRSERIRLSSLCANSGRDNDMLDFMEEPMDSLVGDIPKNPVPPEQDELSDFVRCVVKAADGRKAVDIAAIRTSKVSTLQSFVVIVCGNSRTQNQAIAAAVLEDVEEEYGYRPGSTGVPEGTAASGWTVLDYGSIMVHIMTPKSRLFYNVEGQWKDKGGEYMDISDVVMPNTLEEAGPIVGKIEVPKEEDPFWS